MNTKQHELKKQVALAALDTLTENIVLGVGSGSTVNCFIEALAPIAHRLDIASIVASSNATKQKLLAAHLPVVDANSVSHIDIYIDGADEANAHGQLIKGGGAALTSEKILLANSRHFTCLIDNTKWVPVLGTFPIAIEVIPMARSYVARECVKLGGDPVYREGVKTDHGNVILDVYHFDLTTPSQLEAALNQITGVVCNGIFSLRRANTTLVATPNGIDTYHHST